MLYVALEIIKPKEKYSYFWILSTTFQLNLVASKTHDRSACYSTTPFIVGTDDDESIVRVLSEGTDSPIAAVVLFLLITMAQCGKLLLVLNCKLMQFLLESRSREVKIWASHKKNGWSQGHVTKCITSAHRFSPMQFIISRYHELRFQFNFTSASLLLKLVSKWLKM